MTLFEIFFPSFAVRMDTYPISCLAGQTVADASHPSQLKRNLANKPHSGSQWFTIVGMDEKKTANLQIMVEPSLKAAVDTVAARMSMPTSVLLRTIIVKWLKENDRATP